MLKKNQITNAPEKDPSKPVIRDSQPRGLVKPQDGQSPASPPPNESAFALDPDIMNILVNFVKSLHTSPEVERRLLTEIHNLQTQENLTVNLEKKSEILENVSNECQNVLQYLTKGQSIIKIQAYIRCWTVLADFKKLRKLYSTVSWQERNAEFRDLLNKERVYVSTLQHTVDNYLVPLRNERILKPEQIQSLFTNIEALLVVHQELLRFFEKVYSNWPHLVGIGDAFVKVAPSFRVYGTYVENCSHASLTLLQLTEENEKFRVFLDNVSKSNSMGLQLQGLLFLPLNRISQYKISLENLLNKTPKKHHDYAALARASDMMEKAYNFIENSMVSSKARAEILRIQQKLIGYEGELYHSGRYFIKEGTVLSSEKGKKQPRILYLFNDLLLVAKPEKMGAKVKYTVTFHPHDDVAIDYDKEAKTYPMRFTTGATPNEKDTYIFIFKTEAERRQWMDALGTQLKSVKMKNTVVFGCPLVELLKKDPKQGKIPLVLKLLTSEIEKHLKTQGLFRVPGNEAAKRKLREELDTLDPKVDWKNIDPLAMADVLKSYFRELPQPLFTFELYDRFMAIESEAHNEDDYKRRLAMLIEKLPPENKAVLVFLLQHLIKVAHVPENLMSSTSLAIIFAPGVLRPKNETIEHTFLIPRAHRIFQTLMDDFNFFFKEESASLKVSSALGSHRPKKLNLNRLLMGTLRHNPLEDSTDSMALMTLSTSSSSSNKPRSLRGPVHVSDLVSNSPQPSPVAEVPAPSAIAPPPPPLSDVDLPPPLPQNVPLPPPIDPATLPPPLPVPVLEPSNNSGAKDASPEGKETTGPPKENLPGGRPRSLPKAPTPRPLVNSGSPRTTVQATSPRGQIEQRATAGRRTPLTPAAKKTFVNEGTNGKAQTPDLSASAKITTRSALHPQQSPQPQK